MALPSGIPSVDSLLTIALHTLESWHPSQWTPVHTAFFLALFLLFPICWFVVCVLLLRKVAPQYFAPSSPVAERAAVGSGESNAVLSSGNNRNAARTELPDDSAHSAIAMVARRKVIAVGDKHPAAVVCLSSPDASSVDSAARQPADNTSNPALAKSSVSDANSGFFARPDRRTRIMPKRVMELVTSGTPARIRDKELRAVSEAAQRHQQVCMDLTFASRTGPVPLSEAVRIATASRHIDHSHTSLDQASLNAFATATKCIVVVLRADGSLMTSAMHTGSKQAYVLEMATGFLPAFHTKSAEQRLSSGTGKSRKGSKRASKGTARSPASAAPVPSLSALNSLPMESTGGGRDWSAASSTVLDAGASLAARGSLPAPDAASCIRKRLASRVIPEAARNATLRSVCTTYNLVPVVTEGKGSLCLLAATMQAITGNSCLADQVKDTLPSAVGKLASLCMYYAAYPAMLETLSSLLNVTKGTFHTQVAAASLASNNFAPCAAPNASELETGDVYILSLLTDTEEFNSTDSGWWLPASSPPVPVPVEAAAPPAPPTAAP